MKKFRIWNVVLKEYIYAPDKTFLIGLDGRLFDGNGCPYDEFHILEQFTSLKDKNGREIYEGDIVVGKSTPKYNDREELIPDSYQWIVKGIVGFKYTQFSILNIESNYVDSLTLYHQNDGDQEFPENEIEIIGNIHTTPESIPSIKESIISLL